MAEHDDLTRRELIQITAAGALAAAGATAGLAEQAPKFFSKDEFAMVDELTELIIPADDHSPGARAAQVAEYIDTRLAEAFDDKPRQRWRDGLKRIDAISQEMHSRSFMECSHEQRVALLTRISRNEAAPEAPEEHFFNELKGNAAHTYYTSKIGIHQEMEYKGNVLLPEFVGYEVK
jgi:gluconate 2-dehydrogenase subunit 3-like protein